MYRSICLGLIALLPLCAAAAQQYPQVISVEFEGNGAVESARLKSSMRSCREGASYRPESLKFEMLRLEKLYQDAGFLRVRLGPPAVDVKTLPGKGEGVAISIPVAEGPMFTLGDVSILNVEVLKAPSLMQMSPVRTGQPYNRGRMAQWRDKIAENYQSLGYLRFQAELQEKIDDRRHVVDLVLDCKEGRSYLVGKITVEGDEGINTPDFKRRLLVSEGGVYNPEMLSLTIHFLNEMRTYAPIRQSDVRLEIDDQAGKVDLVFHLRFAKKPSSSLEE